MARRANPWRESLSKRGVRGVQDDLRRIFIGPIPGQCRGLRSILDGFAADCIVVDSMFLGALPLALGPRAARRIPVGRQPQREAHRSGWSGRPGAAIPQGGRVTVGGMQPRSGDAPQAGWHRGQR